MYGYIMSWVTQTDLGHIGANNAWWRHQMEIFSTLLAICAGTGDRWPVNSPHKGQWRGDLMFSLICAWINGWVNNGEAGDLRRHRAYYDVTVMGCHVTCSLMCPFAIPPNGQEIWREMWMICMLVVCVYHGQNVYGHLRLKRSGPLQWEFYSLSAPLSENIGI